MSQQVSVGSMVKQVAALLGTTSLNPWEQGFIESVVRASNNGANTPALTDNQVDKLEEIWRQHFAA